MTTTPRLTGGNDAIVVSVILDGEHARALDTLCGLTLSSRAGLVRRCLVESLRREGLLPEPQGAARTRGGA